MNDLIGLEYRWGAKPGDGSRQTDCFQLACEIRRRMGLSDLSEEFAWTYEQYSAETLKRLSVSCSGETARAKMSMT